MQYESYKLKNRDEVVQFESLLLDYVFKRTQIKPSHISLVNAYEILQQREDGGKIFTALLDLYINFMLLFCDIICVGAAWNNNFSKGKLEGGSVLDTPAKFIGKMEMHRYNTAFVLRYRALWDKLMGFLILLKAPKEYEKFINSKSKKKAFKKIKITLPESLKEAIGNLDKILSDFDNDFRTSEAHGTGVLRKYSFTMESIDKNPLFELFGYWDFVNDFVANLGFCFKKQTL